MNKLTQLFKRPDLRNKIFFILFILAVYRLISNVPIPAIDASQLRNFFATNQFFGLLSTFTGGSLSQLSIGMLGLGPYITASIIMQLLTMIFPALEQMYKYEGEAGRMKFNQYSRMLTVPLAALQGYGFLIILQRSNVLGPMDLFTWVSTILTIVGGSIFLMWLGELITEKNMGNGVSLLIFAGIVAGFPAFIQQKLFTYNPGLLFSYLALIVISLVVIMGVIYITEGQRSIPINYARRIRGMKMYGGVSTYLPMRINNAGVMPIIFALSLLLFPGLIASYLVGSRIPFVASAAQSISVALQPGNWIYSLAYFILVVLFTYFYTAVTFDPKSISENIQKQGGYIPGIRPGPMTAQFLSFLLNRVTLVGAIFLGVIAVLPYIVQPATSVADFTVGGTSVLIVVSVALEIMKQVRAQLAMYDY